jgi:hypothetical protein
MPTLSWSPEGDILYTTNHTIESGDYSKSDKFDVTAVLPAGGSAALSENDGIFAYPAASPVQGKGYLLAYLRAKYPAQSDTSKYRLWVMDRDGSNARAGAGGGPIAANLAKKDFRVLLLEAGSDMGDHLTYQVPGFHTQATEDPMLQCFIDETRFECLVVFDMLRHQFGV